MVLPWCFPGINTRCPIPAALSLAFPLAPGLFAAALPTRGGSMLTARKPKAKTTTDGNSIKVTRGGTKPYPKTGGFVPWRYKVGYFTALSWILRPVAGRFAGTSSRGGATVCVFLARRH